MTPILKIGLTDQIEPMNTQSKTLNYLCKVALFVSLIINFYALINLRKSWANEYHLSEQIRQLHQKTK